MVTKASSGCGVAGTDPPTIVQFAIDTNCPSNASGLLFSAAIVVATGNGAGPLERTTMPYGDVGFSSDSVRSSRSRPPLKPMRPKASTTCPGVVDVNGVGVSVERYTLTPPVASCT